MKKVLLVMLLAALATASWAQQMKSIEFRDQNIRDILLTLGELNSVSIVPDDTVTGKASYVFSDMDFKQALQLFLDTFKLTFALRNNVYYVSRVSVRINTDGTIDMSAADVPVRDMLRALSNQIGKTILYDNLPNDPLTINVQKAKVDDILKIAIARYPDFSLDVQDKYYYLRSKAVAATATGVPSAGDAIRPHGDLYDLQITRARFKDLLLSLFKTSRNQFLYLLDKDMIIENVFLKDLSFEESLKVLLLQINADFKMDDGIYYIYEVQRRDLLRKYLTNVVVPFQYISSADFLKLVPPNFNAGTFFRLDEKGNKIVLSGSLEEIKPIWDFVKLIDQPSGSSTLRVDLQYVKTDEVIPLMPPDLAGFNPVALPSKTALLVNLPEGKKKAFLDFIKLVDQPVVDVPVHLRFMKADDLLAKLPPSVADTNVVKTNDPTLVFFKGSPELLQKFKKDLAQLDVPRPLLRYEILVLQFQEGRSLSITPGVTIQSGGGNGQALTGALGQLLNFNFDVVSNFGATFGVSLNAAITENAARVVADTTLHGLSGEKISFQNTTSTYYVANEISTSGTATVVGSVNQLSSGLIVNLQGWISSDDMVTLQVDATLSKQDTSSTSSTATSSVTLPPNTTEKKLSTQVRMLSGQPLIIGGLKEEDKTKVLTKTPILGDVPLLGLLFRGTSDQTTRTEFSIYIVPILDRPDEQTMSQDDRMLMYYRKLHKEAG